MTREEAREYAKTMTYRDAVYNLTQARNIPYRKATLIKVYELLDLIQPQEQEPYICDTCKNKENGWDTEPCDGCCGNHSGYEPCDDAISRQAVLDGIEELKKSPWATDKHGNGFEYLITEALEVVADLCVKKEPSVKPQEQTGHWIVGRIFPTKVGDENLIEYRCSECDRRIRCTESQLVNYPYCHCGAKMESEE